MVADVVAFTLGTVWSVRYLLLEPSDPVPVQLTDAVDTPALHMADTAVWLLNTCAGCSASTDQTNPFSCAVFHTAYAHFTATGTQLACSRTPLAQQAVTAVEHALFGG